MVGGVETGSGVKRTHGKAIDEEDWAVLHLRVDKLRGTNGEQDRLRYPGFQCGEIKPRNLWL